jgi:micrococcal nuclease
MILLMLTCCSTSLAAGWRGKVVEVIDGDQIRVRRGQVKQIIRIYGIDAPEPRQPFGEQAQRFVADAILEKVVSVEPVGKTSIGILIARIKIGPKTISEELLKAGLAWQYRTQDTTSAYEEMERAARSAGLGLWAVKGRIPPWTWRGEDEPKELGPLIGAQIGEQYGATAVDVTHPVTGDVNRKVAHWFTCERSRCQGCTVHFETMEEARRAGYKAHQACLAAPPPGPAPPPAPPGLPWSSELRCKLHKDCTFAYSPCNACPACTPLWRAVTNQTTYRRQEALYAGRRVKCAPCNPCPENETHWLGTRAVCIKGQCQPR